ncbi:MAG TPA: zf-HC2 domain-containing protein [Gemmatimonadales bacterium]|nr:zf-HC2 domain-containing protein [Gemmatimonadales bacterium]
MRHPESELLSQFLDGDLAVEQHQQVASHLKACTECDALLGELRRVLARAQALEDRPPRHDLWPGVAAAIGVAPPVRRRIQVSVPALLAASIALMVATGGTVVYLMRGHATPIAVQPRGSAPVTLSPASGATLAAAPEARGYDAAIRSLESQLAAAEPKLDTTTVRVVREKLDLIDRAIGEAQQALAADPSNNYLNGHLTATRLRKLELLRRVAALGRQVS